MNFIFGTITNAINEMKLQTEWGKKKEELQTKKQKDAYQKMTQEQRMLEDFKKQCEDNTEAGTSIKIEGKLMAGKELTPEEEKWLQEHDPESLADYKRLQAEKTAYKEKLKHCKTKEDVNRLRMNSLSGDFTECRRISTNPNIPKKKKVALLKKLMMKVSFDEEAQVEFVETGEYRNLKTDQEVLDEAKEIKEELAEEISSEEVVEETLNEQNDNQVNENDDSEKIDTNVIEEIKSSKKKVDIEQIHHLDNGKDKVEKLDNDNEPKDVTIDNVKVEIVKAIRKIEKD